MPKYKIDIAKTLYQNCTLTIEAEDEDTAMEIALEEAEDFITVDSEIFNNGCELITEEKK